MGTVVERVIVSQTIEDPDHAYRRTIWHDPALGKFDGIAIHTAYLHREDGPAIIEEECCEFWFENQIHRYDGPAEVFNSHRFSDDWYIRGQYVNEKEYKEWLIEMGMDINNLTPEDKMLIDLKWG